MAYFRLGMPFVPRWLSIHFQVLVCSVAWIFALAAEGYGQETEPGFYVVKQYPDGSRTKVKWENIGRTKDLTGSKGGAATFRPARRGELEK